MLLLYLLSPITVIQLSSKNQTHYISAKSFEIGWIHSVEKEPWFETYEVHNQKFLLIETRFKTFGAGTPSEAIDTTMKNGFVYMKMNRLMEEIHLTVSDQVQTTFYTKDQTIRLYEWVDNYESVTIQVQKIPRWLLLGGG